MGEGVVHAIIDLSTIYQNINSTHITVPNFTGEPTARTLPSPLPFYGRGLGRGEFINKINKEQNTI